MKCDPTVAPHYVSDPTHGPVSVGRRHLLPSCGWIPSTIDTKNAVVTDFPPVGTGSSWTTIRDRQQRVRLTSNNNVRIGRPDRDQIRAHPG